MGDECKLPSLLEDSESCFPKDFKKGEKEFPNRRYVRESSSGEPGNDKLEIPKVMDAENFPEVAIVEPLPKEPEVAPFPYSRTKLRPDAPPFTPESVTPVGGTSYREPESEATCFVNVDLESQDNQLIPVLGDLVVPQPLKENKDPTLKPFSLTSTPILKKQVPNVQVRVVEEDDAVIPIPTNEPPTGEVTMGSPTSQSRNFSTAFILRNKTQIAVIIASLVICAILIAYTVV